MGRAQESLITFTKYGYRRAQFALEGVALIHEAESGERRASTGVWRALTVPSILCKHLTLIRNPFMPPPGL